MATRFVITFSGSVQGVGFRFTSVQVANSIGICGTVRNLGNGNVELICEAKRAEVEKLIKAISAKTHGHVSRTVIEEEVSTGEFEGFEIIG